MGKGYLLFSNSQSYMTGHFKSNSTQPLLLMMPFNNPRVIRDGVHPIHMYLHNRSSSRQTGTGGRSWRESRHQDTLDEISWPLFPFRWAFRAKLYTNNVEPNRSGRLSQLLLTPVCQTYNLLSYDIAVTAATRFGRKEERLTWMARKTGGKKHLWTYGLVYTCIHTKTCH